MPFFFPPLFAAVFPLQPELLTPVGQAGWGSRELCNADCYSTENTSQQLSQGIKHPWLFAQETRLWLCTTWLGTILRV